MRAPCFMLVSTVATLAFALVVGAQDTSNVLDFSVAGVRLRHAELRDSQLAAHRRRVEDAVRASGERQVQSKTNRRGPLSDRGPFHEYNWVFAANLILGAAGGAFAIRTRRWHRGESAAAGWLAFGGCLGIAGAGVVFVFFLFVIGILSVMSNPISPSVMFGFTVPVIALASAGMAFNTGRRRFPGGWPR